MEGKNMERTEIVEIVVNEISEIVGIDKEKIKPESSLMDDIGITSLEVLVLVGKLETLTGVSLNQQDTMEIETVSDVVEAIIKKGQKNE